MRKTHCGALCVSLMSLSISLGPANLSRAQVVPAPATRTLLKERTGGEPPLTPSSDQVSVSRSPGAPGVDVTIRPGQEGYPGVRLQPESKTWDLSAFGHVEARIVNTGDQPLQIALRVDNAGDWKDNPWNTEMITLAPGASGTVKTIFGYSYGYKPGYALKPAAVVGVLLFTPKADAARSFRIESIVAAGPAGEKPPVSPDAVRIRPVGGVLLGAGAAQAQGDAKQVVAQGARASLSGEGLKAIFPASSENGSVSLKPAVGRWDLRTCLEVRVRVRNLGSEPVTPRARLETNGGPSDWFAPSAPIAPGAAGEIAIPFLPTTPPDLGKPETATRITNDAVSAVTLATEKTAGERTLLVTSAHADTPPPPQLPEWLGKRPPVPGDWVMTLKEEFNGASLDTALWDPEGENYYDKATHWSKEDVIVGGGVARLRYEKKTGFHNDDPKRNKTDYAAGYLNGYNRWAQRYGYFEARMKLPSAPGLWPAFWMMPDRGTGASDRQSTADGGMEFDIMEHLTRWGPNRYNIAMHYDGYEKDHKQIGSDKVYVQPDRDGFITCGLLWTPGLAVYYCNGREVLRWDNPRISHVPSVMMFTLPSGGWDNDALDDARLPADFVIDYVRVWQRKDLASSADSKPRIKE